MSLPKDEFNNPENIQKLFNCFEKHNRSNSASAMINFIVTAFAPELKQGSCFLQQDEEFEQILKEENIPYKEMNNGWYFIGNHEILPDMNGWDNLYDGTTDELELLGRFLGVPDEDNMYTESNRNENWDKPPKDNESLRLSKSQKQHLRVLSWMCKPTRERVKNAVQMGEKYEKTVKNVAKAHPKYEEKILSQLEYVKNNSNGIYG